MSMVERVYYPINEQTARLAHDMMSFDDYRQGSKTAAYKGYCDKAYDLVDKIAEVRPKEADRAARIATAYARRMADNMNRESRIGTMCPSVMISGGSNFPVRKKQRQNAAHDNNMREYFEIQKYIEKLEHILTARESIRSDDEDAIIRLEEKLSKLEALQERMKEINAYYRKHKTLEGCPELTEQQIAVLAEDMQKEWRVGNNPIPSYRLANNGAEIRRIKARLDQLRKEKSRESSEVQHEDIDVTVEEDVEDMRLRLHFPGKPEPQIRDLLKTNGFKWSPRNECWQRQLNDDARYAARHILEKLKEDQHGEDTD